MSLSAISPVSSPVPQPAMQRPAVPAPAAQPISSPAATVSLSSSGQAAASSGDVDRDGDSH